MSDLERGQLDAMPTKEFFIFMLTRDVPLRRAILDLVDNSVDGAVRCVRDRQDRSLSGFWIKIETSRERFVISDNCGGMDVDVARLYAFRFGRPDEMKDKIDTSEQIGQFGVGMKRSIFKLGDGFRISSTTTKSRFVVKEDVNDWKYRKEWRFEFSELDETPQDSSLVGTSVEVAPLHSRVSDEFVLDNFRNALAEEIRTAHAAALGRGLSIFLNGAPLQGFSFELLQSKSLRPVVREFIPTDGVQVRIIAGVHEVRSLSDGGWYIFCHDRMVLGPDQTETTGWGRQLPAYHADFAYFRGYVFFDAVDTSLLPWTTTKTGVDEDSPVFRTTVVTMAEVAKPVLEYLRSLAREKSAVEHEGEQEAPLEEARISAEPAHVESLPDGGFVAPRRIPRTRPSVQRIQYDRPRAQVEKVKRQLGVNTYKEVGEHTFDYYYSAECV